ncbi:metallophosphoesterase [Roseibium sp. TrichSKD4]|uniref:metallophosphoesterase family protein n=1 Tax=Roseibium sp. TrichSKD4 TaxID=744980 RepID=UPI0001E56795|nr:metallophosphoesterase [Roseibium sp. TrichSKD4]EFO31711.1 metallophosphoesterase [Roseibium sp. TrichSKD4]
MLKLAHLSDPHLGPLPNPKLIQLFSKRILGYLNWWQHRSKNMGGNHLEQLVADMQDQTPDHVAITGDLVNIALPLEIIGARTWLEGVGSPEHVTVVPGNHDAYVPGALKKARDAWLPYMSADNGLAADHPDEASFPFVRRRKNIALVGVSTARATGPWFATGRVGSKQSRALRDTLKELGDEGLFRVVMIHHPPFPKATNWHKRLSDASRVRAMIKRVGAELVLHGHTHIDSFKEIEGPNGPVPVIGVPSATSAPGGKKPAARYNIFEIDGSARNWNVQMTERGFTGSDSQIEKIRSRDLSGFYKS